MNVIKSVFGGKVSHDLYIFKDSVRYSNPICVGEWRIFHRELPITDTMMDVIKNSKDTININYNDVYMRINCKWMSIDMYGDINNPYFPMMPYFNFHNRIDDMCLKEIDCRQHNVKLNILAANGIVELDYKKTVYVVTIRLERGLVLIDDFDLIKYDGLMCDLIDGNIKYKNNKLYIRKID